LPAPPPSGPLGPLPSGCPVGAFLRWPSRSRLVVSDPVDSAFRAALAPVPSATVLCHTLRSLQSSGLRLPPLRCSLCSCGRRIPIRLLGRLCRTAGRNSTEVLPSLSRRTSSAASESFPEFSAACQSPASCPFIRSPAPRAPAREPHCPASPVLRACPPPLPIRSVPPVVAVESPSSHQQGLPVLRQVSPSTLAVANYPA